MQRVVSINLDGNAYQLEENGYNALFAFLDAVDAQLKDDPERAQKTADLEARVAELCKACLAPHKNVVTSIEIDRIVAQLVAERGPITARPSTTADTSGATGQTTAGPASPGSGSSQSGSSPGGPWVHRRLYQIREGSMISGVCMGLAEYMRIDVTFIRIMFALFALTTGGWGIIMYAILMFVVPRVETRAAASAHDASGTFPPHRWPWDHGWPWENGWPWDKHGWPWDPPKTPQPPTSAAPRPAANAQEPPRDSRQLAIDARLEAREARWQAREARREWRAQARANRMAYHPAGSFWGLFVMITCVGFAFFWLSVWTRGQVFFGWPYFWGLPHWVGLVIFLWVLRLIFVPFSPGYGPYANPHYGWIAMWNGVAWLAFMIFGIWAAYQYVPEFREFMHSFQTSWQSSGFLV